MQKWPLCRDFSLCSGLLLFCYRNSGGGAVYRPIFVGASDGSMAAQIYTQKYPAEVGGLVLDSTGGMDAATLKSLKKEYFFAPIALWYLAHCNYEKMKPRLIKLGMSHIRDESPEQITYVSGGHLGTVLREGEYVKKIGEFLEGMP